MQQMDEYIQSIIKEYQEKDGELQKTVAELTSKNALLDDAQRKN